MTEDIPDVTLAIELGDPDMIARGGLADPEGHLLAVIAGDGESQRDDVAGAYRLVLQSTDRERVNWRRVNEAILERWSKPTLEWIKREAWRQA